MTFQNLFTARSAAIGWVCAGALTSAACANGGGIPTGPSASIAAAGLAASSPRSGDLQVTKECSEYTGAAGSFCTITASNIKAIEVGSRVYYAQAAGATSLDSDVVLNVGPGNAAFGHCRLEFATGLGVCTFSGGTGKFIWFSATENVSYLGGPNWAWAGTYSFTPRD